MAITFKEENKAAALDYINSIKPDDPNTPADEFIQTAEHEKSGIPFRPENTAGDNAEISQIVEAFISQVGGDRSAAHVEQIRKRFTPKPATAAAPADKPADATTPEKSGEEPLKVTGQALEFSRAAGGDVWGVSFSKYFNTTATAYSDFGYNASGAVDFKGEVASIGPAAEFVVYPLRALGTDDWNLTFGAGPGLTLGSNEDVLQDIYFGGYAGLAAVNIEIASGVMLYPKVVAAGSKGVNADAAGTIALVLGFGWVPSKE